ncbi:NUDIX domain-containing protein [Rhodobium gokarnense]|uniref:ADP-ribose pyrophosphatase YjhB (NUDIX family) n=1 Tax=Rhodobium gokarnense TaxID=364296 RepID=A0ABT3HHY5_9HYPH|nr:NUDIX domain-containing protein [Rhodobium gokarnense]MCW2309959.1 ADP-ribose pyrophosphatase YjhB (NUDIX family) [Rhodobium gokarnense]
MRFQDDILPRLGPWIRPFLKRYWLVSRGMTLGVRGAVFDGDGRVFLIRHTYVPGWHLPGGGVDLGETVRQALDKELREEGNIRLLGEPQLFAVYHNVRIYRRDHVVLFVARQWEQPEAPVPNAEIAEHGWFQLDALPAETSPATRRRLDEIAGDQPPAAVW